MIYEGQDVLISECMGILQGLEQDYKKYGKNLAKESQKQIDPYDLDDTLELIFDAIFKTNLDKEASLKQINKCFGNDETYANYFILKVLFHLLHRFSIYISKSDLNSTIYIIYLENAIDAFTQVLMKTEAKTKISSPQSFKFGTSGGFMLFGDIIDEFRAALRSNSSLRFLNLYYGVNVSCDAKIASIEDDKVLFKVNLMQILAMKEEENAYILKGDNLVSNVKADILSINLSNNTVLLNNFVRMENMFANQRKFPRVHPNQHTKVILSNKFGVSIEGKLYDISQGGIGVVSIQNGGFKSGEELMAKFSLTMPRTKEVIDVYLELNLVVALNYQGSMRYCCEIVKPQSITEKIVEFSKLRVKDTLDELQQKVELYR
ncbi:PilZ domain-containing protein [Campylobacter fetus]|uniref:PilZ domain-containing protein n=3 Tax=Campylobacter fetus TaxID=196 RepID=A0A5L9WPM3_CAMFE|nr:MULTISPECIES: PilZ domain-containing protein [Campylobacter]OCS22947.1 hypothetical protein CFVI97532_01490 [Campylobacter fetus subsp. venerealis cfvi97/532]OCS27143.1 hypothetical protein CFVB10_00240 [Campylobacter fetus subsp. venerealis cfvB10]OCS30247.1 hypothetical protein CFVCCUG33900_01785 [Campylobacter fetus subsp. venerealis LMG 6570 = CCUG 33900]OCS41626.1 hypothetical protein CFVI02298_06725 [Campylobacter fetus subsp. venerealis cfvi02/298]ABK83326.1 hypothetical protein CFF8